MKRGAERQLTKDGPDDEDIEEIQEPQGFQKADEASLATRQIRALPKRALSASRPPSLNGLPPTPAPDVDKVEAPPKFVGFVGFGPGTATSNPFTFSAQPPPVSATTSSVFGSASSSEKSTAVVKPAVMPVIPGAIDLFPDASLPQPAVSAPAQETDALAFKYFKSLRGLNVSFLSAISTAVEKDPFFDVASLVESYKNLRTTIQSEFDGPAQSTIHRGPVTTNSVPLFGPTAPSAKHPSLPVQKPFAGSAEAASKPPTGENGTKTSGFTFPPFVPPSSSAPTPLPFGLASKRSESSTSSTTLPDSVKPAFTLPSSSTSTSGLPFAAPSNAENTTSILTPGSSDQGAGDSSTNLLSRPTSVAPSVGSSGAPSFFSTTKPTSVFGVSDPTSKPTSVFGSPIFGSSGTTESSKLPPLSLPPSDNKDSSKVATTLFGSTMPASSTSGSIFGSSSDKPVSFFGSATPPKTGAFTFGKPGGSIGNPVGFGFGGSSPSAGDTTISGPSSSGFNFGAPSTKPSERLFSPPVTDKSSESTPQPEAEGNEEGGEDEATKLLPSHTHDEEGEGEEDEETTYVVRCKIYRLSKSEDKSEWKDLGVGMLRLKKHKETDVRRVLMRNSNTGRILINFRLYGNLKLSLAKTSISFIGYENSAPTSFRVRVKTEEQAGDLKQAFEREIAAVRATE